MKVKLSNGGCTIVDDDFPEELLRYKWRKDTGGYAMRRSARDGKQYSVWLHRVVNKIPEDKFTDHINGDKLDNRKSNLRTATRIENSQNQKPTIKKLNKICSSRFKGVFWKKQYSKWCVALRVNGKRIHGGYFESETDAAKEYNRQAKMYFGEYAYLNEVTNG